MGLIQYAKDVSRSTRKLIATSIYSLPPQIVYTPPLIVELKHDFEGAVSFSQRGEDLIAVDWLYRCGRPFETLRYLDIGANHPRHLSNTYLLWTMGLRGVLVEPDPVMAAKLREARQGDIVLEAGIAFDDRRLATLYRMADPALSGYISGSGAVDKIITPLIPINEVLSKHFPDRAPDFLSIDAEQCDYQILLTLDFKRWRPYLICVETGDGATGLPDLLLDKGYEIVCHSGANTMVISRAI